NFKKAPYIREVQDGCGSISYKAAVDKLLALERKGYIRRQPNKHRGIELEETISVGEEAK
ncbi:MAG: repressor LexA, partial [Candidatus Omnitrophota bacterium]